MNITQELRDLIKEYTIGYRTIEEYEYEHESSFYKGDYIVEVWKGDQRFQTGMYRSWYPNGNLRYEVNYVYGKHYGISKFWHLDGTLGVESNYDIGIGKCLYLNGDFKIVCDHNTGILKSYDKYGRIITLNTKNVVKIEEYD